MIYRLKIEEKNKFDVKIRQIIEFINNFGCNWRLKRKIFMEKRIKLALTKRNEEPRTKFEKKAKLKV